MKSKVTRAEGAWQSQSWGTGGLSAAAQVLGNLLLLQRSKMETSRNVGRHQTDAPGTPASLSFIPGFFFLTAS